MPEMKLVWRDFFSFRIVVEDNVDGTKTSGYQNITAIIFILEYNHCFFLLYSNVDMNDINQIWDELSKYGRVLFLKIDYNQDEESIHNNV